MSPRLNQKAYKIIAAEIARAAAKDNIVGEAQKIALKQLKHLNSAQGQPVTEAELKYLISDLFPHFDLQVIKKALRANRPPSSLWLIPKMTIALGSLAGLIWLLNLPYPMIRRPVAQTAPVLLLPSYLNMDRNYRQAIALVEQTDQLVNQGTSLADFKLGQEKVAQAQKHLDALPVWFLGYEPQMYRTMFSFGWKFTLDEFESARAKVGRMNARIFQEINAIALLEQAQQDIHEAKQNYQKAQDDTAKQQAIAAWQTGIDRLNQLPSRTLANEQAKSSYEPYLCDFHEVRGSSVFPRRSLSDQVSGLAAGNSRTNKIVAVAQQFHDRAISNCANSPHSANRWQECSNLLSRAVKTLEQVPLEDAGYLKTQTLVAAYETELSNMRIRQQEEEQSQQAYESAQSMIANLPKSVDRFNREVTATEVLTIINQLEKVKPQTTAHADARVMMNFANQKLQQLR